MREHNGTVQPGAPVVLAPVPRITKADIIGALDALGTWQKPNQVRQALPDSKWLHIGISNMADRLRDMAHAGEIARRYDKHSRPEYRRIEE